MKQQNFILSVTLLCGIYLFGIIYGASIQQQQQQKEELDNDPKLDSNYQINNKNDIKRNSRELLNNNDVQIIEFGNVINDDGGYEYKTVLDDGSLQNVKGNIKEVNGTKIISVTGTYSYILPTGEQFTVTYVADERGYSIKSISQTLPEGQN